jgi:hypothetical protein
MTRLQRSTVPQARDAGVAALELGLMLTLLFLVLGLVFPLGQMMIEKHRLDRTLADAIRFASATPNTAASDSDARRPSAAAVQAAALKSYHAAGGGNDGFSADVSTTSIPGEQVEVRLHKDVKLGPLGSLMHGLGFIHTTTVTVSASATGREE